MERKDITVFQVDTTGLIAAHSIANNELSDAQIESFITIGSFDAKASGSAVSFFETTTCANNAIYFMIVPISPVAGHTLAFNNFTITGNEHIQYFENPNPINSENPEPGFTLKVKDNIDVPKNGISIAYTISFSLAYIPFNDDPKKTPVVINFNVDPRIKIRHRLK